ncbi:MAG: hypothetical protein EOP38_00190 [Rubrivivax sp.]|nr:MAG: hypothetical protein EOP38_00190 [Rubrivivax sp.]
MLYTKFHRRDQIAVQDLVAMYELFRSYYDYAPMDVFLSDIEKKSGAFLIRSKSTHQLVGFSTLAIYQLQLNGKNVKGLFSGDTIIKKEYWGSRSLQVAFTWKVIWEALKNPFTQQYWLLISKGYKTYLLMSRNFQEFYPRKDAGAKDKRLKPLIIDYCEKLFPGRLDHTSMLLDFGEEANRLKSGVAEIDGTLHANEPDVLFFEQCNPSWRLGTELPCIARADLASLLKLVPRYFLKVSGLFANQNDRVHKGKTAKAVR